MPERSRTITIRLTDWEYTVVKKRCNELGPVNISEFARAAMMHSLDDGGEASAQSRIDLQLAAIQNRLSRLEQQVSKMLGTGPSDAAGSSERRSGDRDHSHH